MFGGNFNGTADVDIREALTMDERGHEPPGFEGQHGDYLGLASGAISYSEKDLRKLPISQPLSNRNEFNIRKEMGLGVGANIIDPMSQNYLDWYRGFNKKLHKNKLSVATNDAEEMVKFRPQIS